MDISESSRKNPLKRPQNHIPPVPRWQLVFPTNATRVFTAYVGIQQTGQLNTAAIKAKHEAEAHIQSIISSRCGDAPLASERFICIRGHDVPNSTVWVCYWNSDVAFQRSMAKLDPCNLCNQLDADGQAGLGLWCEAFSSLTARLETNYTGLDYLPGLAKLPGTSTQAHTLTAYWGAARDRIPDAAFDEFSKVGEPLYSHELDCSPKIIPSISASNNGNVVHIRSGQFWETCSPEEAQAYERRLKPALESGLKYLWDHPLQSGAMGIRYLRNAPINSETNLPTERKETCVAGFFDNLASLEKWAHTHKSHLAIYQGAMNHAKNFGADRKLRTWHEVSVLEKGSATFKYVNCASETGIASFLLRKSTG